MSSLRHPLTLGEQDASLNHSTTLRHSRYIGGSDDDGGYSLKLNGNGQVYVTGGTKSADFPATSTTIQPSFAGITDGFLGLFDAGDGSQGNTTFLGTAVYDQSYLVEVDRDGDVYVTGQSEGNYPTANAAYSEVGGNHFIHKISPDLTTTIYSGFGPGKQVKLSPSAFLVDKCERSGGWGGLVITIKMPVSELLQVSPLPQTSLIQTQKMEATFTLPFLIET